MFTLAKLYEFCHDAMIKSGIPGTPILTPSESHAINKLNQATAYRQLLVVYPSHDSFGSQDSLMTNNVTSFFVIEKHRTGISIPEEIAFYDDILVCIHKILEEIAKVKETECDLFKNFDENKYSIEPIYNEFGGWDGYSLDFIF
jgi:hypothetical protein